MLPSIVSFKTDKEVLVGELAQGQTVLNKEVTVTKIKREMGTDHQVEIRNRKYSPIEISSLIIRKIKEYTEQFLGYPVKNAIITVPAYFNDNQRVHTKLAGELAGLKVIKLLNEPTAAALAYGYSKGGERNLLVVDLGGGTLDITILQYKDNYFKVLGVGGSTQLGGSDFDQELVKLLAESFRDEHQIDLLSDPIAHQQLLIHSERIKIDLSTVTEGNIVIPYISMSEQRPLHLNQTVTRDQFEKLIMPYASKLQDLVCQTFEQAGINKNWVETVILVGGSTRVPLIERTIKELFPEAGFKKDLNPDEIVAMGAGVLAGIISREITDMHFMDVTSHNLGIENHKGEFIELIAAGTTYPVEARKLVTTTDDNQTEVVIHIQQNGRQTEEKATVSLGRFHLKNITAAPAGTSNIEVIFKIDMNGMLEVTAIDLDTGKKEGVGITITDAVANVGEKIMARRGGELSII